MAMALLVLQYFLHFEHPAHSKRFGDKYKAALDASQVPELL
jgi:hypothetical protein